jgi:hypothetical protein
VDLRQAQSWEIRPALAPNEMMSLAQEKVLVLLHRTRQYRFIGERLNPIPLFDRLPGPPVLPHVQSGPRQYTAWRTAASGNREEGDGSGSTASLTNPDHY